MCNEPSRVPCGATGHDIALDQEHITDARIGQVVGDARTHDPTAHDHDGCAPGQSVAGLVGEDGRTQGVISKTIHGRSLTESMVRSSSDRTVADPEGGEAPALIGPPTARVYWPLPKNSMNPRIQT